MTRLTTVDDASADIAAGRMVVVHDATRDETRLVMAAQHITPDAVNFMRRDAGGWISVALSPERCADLGLLPMSAQDEVDDERPQFMATIEARTGVVTGISAQDQARTMLVAADPAYGADDLVSPGHVRPLRARAGGVLEHDGWAEAAVDLARLAACAPAGVLCEIQHADGTLVRWEDLDDYCRPRGFAAITIGDLVAHRCRHETLVERVVSTALPTRFGNFDAVGYHALLTGEAHLALVKGDVAAATGVLVRVHVGCAAGDVFQSRLCGCAQRLKSAQQRIEHEGRGVIVYLRPGAEVLAGQTACHTQRSPKDDRHDVGVVAQILAGLDLGSVRLLSDDTREVAGLRQLGIDVLDPAAEGWRVAC